jgi:GNAT superfamily N-acetyltransferase
MDEIRRLYDQQQRINIEYANTRREVTPRTVRLIDTLGGHSTIIHSQVDEATADATIRAEQDYFRGLDGFENLEWKLFDYDQPADLKARLVAHGFTPEEPDAVLILDLEAIPTALLQPVTHDVRRITDPANLDGVRSIKQAVWGDDGEDWVSDTLGATLRDAPDELSVYVAYVDGIPASAAWIDFHEGNAFSGLWGGSTLPQYRNRGLYTALVSVRAQEAIRRGARYLTIDASPMSRAVLEKHGFQLMAYAWECNWRG